VIFIFWKQIKRFLFPRKRVKHRKVYSGVNRSHRIKARKGIPRSVNTPGSGKGYPKYGGGTIPFIYTKDGKLKQAKFVGGTVAAHNHMAHLRKNR
jgi:hypothetical protein